MLGNDLTDEHGHAIADRAAVPKGEHPLRAPIFDSWRNSAEAHQAYFTREEIKAFSNIECTEPLKADADTGCSRGIFKEASAFTHLEALPRPVHILCADGSIMTATQGGMVHIYIEHDGNWNTLILPDQLLVPKASCNLVSIGRLTEFSYKA